MLKVARPEPRTLVITDRPTGALVRLIIWIGVVFIFYLAVLDDTALVGESPPGPESGGWHEWLLLLFPLFLLPYLFSLVRSLLRAGEFTFDGRSRTLSTRTQPVAAFSEIRELRLRTIHGSCEEFRLSAVLGNGRGIKLIEAKASAQVDDLAAEISELVGVDVIREV